MKKVDWEDPYYHYTLANRAITISVAASAPVFPMEVDGLSDVVAEFRKREYERILDFGAGKLRNTLYLLRKGFKVWAVEFKETMSTPVAKKRHTAAKRFKGFFVLEYPKQFLQFQGEFDAVLLINVINIVPDLADREKIMFECVKRLRARGLLLWMSQYGEPHYRPGVTRRLSLADGWVYNLDKRFQTFNKEYAIPEIQTFVKKTGLRELQKITSNHHRAFLFEKD